MHTVSLHSRACSLVRRSTLALALVAGTSWAADQPAGTVAARKDGDGSLDKQITTLATTLSDLASAIQAAQKTTPAKPTPADEKPTPGLNTVAAQQAEISALQASNARLSQSLNDSHDALLNAQAQLTRLQAQLRNDGALASTVAGDRNRAEVMADQIRQQNTALAALKATNNRLAGASRLWPLGAAVLALLAAGLGAAGTRHWWPRRSVRPLTVSAALGAWRPSVQSGMAGPAFGVTARWLPGAAQIHSTGALVARPRIASIEGEAA